jgi:hypothetical protein
VQTIAARQAAEAAEAAAEEEKQKRLAERQVGHSVGGFGICVRGLRACFAAEATYDALKAD